MYYIVFEPSVSNTMSESRSILSATVDVSLSVVALSIVLAPVISVGNTLLGSPLPESAVRLSIGILAVGGSYPFVTGDWSRNRLGEFVFTFTVSVVVLGIVGFLVIGTLGLEIAGNNPLPQLLALAVAYLFASLRAYRDFRAKPA